MSKTRVLLADDHSLFRDGLARILNSQIDFEVIGEATNGLEAIAEAQRLKPDLILMDVTMPVCDGLEATQRIKQEFPNVTIVMLTVNDESEKLFEAIRNGAQGYLLKSIRREEMLTLLRSLRAQGRTLFLVEHIMRAVMGVADRVIVLNYGKKIAEGSPREIISHPGVIHAYLGDRYA